MTSIRTGWAIGAPPPSSARAASSFLEDPEPVLTTTDGGLTWRPAGVSAQSVCAVDPQTAWVASASIARRTLDGGRTWDTTTLYPPKSFWSGTIVCSDASTAWDLAAGDGAMSQQPYIASKTTDGGASWTPVLHEAYFPPPAGVSGFRGQIDSYSGPMAMPSASDIFFAGSSPAANELSVTRSIDGGIAFDHTKFGSPERQLLSYPQAISFPDTRHGWYLVGNGRGIGHLWRTSDGGDSWHRLPLVTEQQAA